MLAPTMIDMNGARAINFRSPVPYFLQLRDILRDLIYSGELPANEPVPSQKELKESYDVGRGTAARAVILLQEEGLVFVVKGKGAYVSPKLPPRNDKPPE